MGHKTSLQASPPPVFTEVCHHLAASEKKAPISQTNNNIPLIGLKVIREFLCATSNHVTHRPKEASAIKGKDSSTVFREHNQWEDYTHLLQRKSRRAYCLLLEDYPHGSEGN